MAILLNTTSLAMKFYNQPAAYTDFLDGVNQVFTYFFLVECILKLGAFRFKVSEDSAQSWQITHTFVPELFQRSLERIWLFHRRRIFCGPGHGKYKCKIFKLPYCWSYLFFAAWPNSLHWILEVVPCCKTGQTAQQRRGDQDPVVDISQVIPGLTMGRPPHCTHLLHLWSGGDADLWPDYKGRWHQHSSEQQLPVFHLVPPGAFPLGHGWGLARNHAVLPQLAWHSLWSWGDQISNYYFGSYFLTFKFFSLTTPAKRKVVGATLPMFISSPSSSSVPS